MSYPVNLKHAPHNLITVGYRPGFEQPSIPCGPINEHGERSGLITPTACASMMKSGKQVACDFCERNPGATHTKKINHASTWREEIRVEANNASKKRPLFPGGRRVLPGYVTVNCENPACGKEYSILRQSFRNQKWRRSKGEKIQCLCDQCRASKGGQRTKAKWLNAQAARPHP